MPTKGLAGTGWALAAALAPVLALLLFLAAPAAAADRSEARKAYDAATAAFGLGHYAEAAEKYETAFSIHPDPALLYNCAQAYRLAGNRDRALELYRNYLRLYPDRSNAEEARSQVAALSKALENERHAAVAPPPVAPAPTPAPMPPAVAPEPVTLSPAPAPSPPPVSQTVAATVTTTPSSEPPPTAGSRTWLWIAVGAAVVVGGTVAILFATRGEKFPDATYGTATGN
jgi:tetratricopeptide (TPR) repeat protein